MTKQTTTNSQSDWMVLAATTFFVSGAFLAFALTAFPKLTLDNWIYWVGGRIVWQLGGAIWFGVVLCNADVLETQGCPWKGAALGALLGLALCFNPVLDVIRGTQVWEGRVTYVSIWEERIFRTTGGSSPTIHARITVESNGQDHQLKLSGRQANIWGTIFQDCYKSNSTIHTVVLQHLNIILDANCSSTGSKRASQLNCGVCIWQVDRNGQLAWPTARLDTGAIGIAIIAPNTGLQPTCSASPRVRLNPTVGTLRAKFSGLEIAGLPCYHVGMIQSFKNAGTEDIFNGENTKAARNLCPNNIWKIAVRKLDQLDSVSALAELRIPPSNRLEALSGDRKGQYSIRINDQYRICFIWTEKGPDQVEIVDYH